MNHPLPPFLAAALHDELEPGETLLWQARPSVWRQMRGTARTFCFGVAVFVFSVVWTAAAGGEIDSKLSQNSSTSDCFLLAWGGLFVGAGLLQLLAPLRAGWLARHTAYAITDRRALILEALRRRTVRSFPGHGSGETERVEHRSGRSDLVFHRVATPGGRGGTGLREIRFFGVREVRAVQRILQHASVSTGS